MEIFVVRHAETDYNVGAIRFRGRKDIPLSELGIKHAEETGKALAKVPVEAIYYSKLSRTRVSAEKIKVHHPKAIFKEEPYLLDMSFGDWEGKTFDEIFVGEEKEKWFTNPHDFIIPNGETFYTVLDRIHRLFKRLEKQEEKVIVLVTHGAVINLIFVYITRTHPSNFWRFYPKPSSISKIVYENGLFYISQFNNTDHLTCSLRNSS
ncbi:MAG: histidine phosphatase family protein [Candidatus Heimdallarchaeaceae archaeon]